MPVAKTLFCLMPFFLSILLGDGVDAISPEQASSERTIGAPSALSPQPSSESAPPQVFPPPPVRLSLEQRQMIGVTYGIVERTTLTKTIRTVGRIDFDERRLADVSFKVGGWVQDVFADYTGKTVRKGEPLLTLYSPDLVTSQEEYLLALRTREQLAHSTLPEARDGSRGLVEAARRRLLLWDLTPRQIDALEKRGASQTYLTLHSPIAGTIVEKVVVQGMRIEPGTRLYRIADLSTVWLYADLYEYEAPLARKGQAVTVTLPYYPGEIFTGQIAYIYPYLDTATRTNKVRLTFANPHGKLKPGMYVNGDIRVDLGVNLTVPESAVVQSGQRQLVFVEQSPGMFIAREVRLGPKADRHFTVLAGLTAGERVVTSGNFLLDSESKLRSAASMMAMMGAIGMGDWKMAGARSMEMGNQAAPASSSEKKLGDLSVLLSTAPESAVQGDTILRVQVKDAAGRPITDALVSIDYTMDMPGMGIDTAEAKHAQAGLYEAPLRFTMAGPWGVTVSIRQPGQAEVRERFTVNVK